MSGILARRRAERDRLLAMAREHVEGLAERRAVSAAVVVGSVARGDFNVWSYVDVIVLIEPLPDRAPDRLALVNDGAPAGVQVVGYTRDEFVAAAWRRNRMALDALDHGVTLRGKLPPVT